MARHREEVLRALQQGVDVMFMNQCVPWLVFGLSCTAMHERQGSAHSQKHSQITCP